VGNLTMGGVGKTVAVQAIARALQQHGLRVCIVSYGFRADHEREYGIVSDFDSVQMDAIQAGDEAFLLARSLPGVPVLIGRRRSLAGRAAVEQFSPDVILLDDAFQHWRLHRDVDMVLLDARHPLGNGRVFPAGLLREIPRSLARASVCLLTRCDTASASELAAAQGLLKNLAPAAPVHETSHESGVWRVAAPTATPDLIAGEAPVLVVAGIGQNEAFVQAVRAAGATVADAVLFPDHHRYTADDVLTILGRGRDCGAVITTEKDAVKLAPLWPESPPLMEAPVRLAGVSPEDWIRICGFPVDPDATRAEWVAID
jgi:tetraacyldisaccharide 4'-kinase